MASTINSNTSSGVVVTSDTSGVLQLQTAGTTAVTIDASQQVGFGVTPSAWGTGLKALQTGASSYASVVDLNNGVTSFGSNFYNNSGNKYTNASSAYPLQYLQDTTTGNHSWRIASAGTAGNAITFTTGMTLDVNGTLGLGVTPSAWSGGINAIQFGPLGAVSSSTTAGTVLSNNAYATSPGWAAKYITTGTASYYEQYAGTHYWLTAPSGTAGNAITFTQAMTLDNSGTLIINATSKISGNTNLSVQGNTNTSNIFEQKDVSTSYATNNYYQVFYNSSNTVAGGIAHNAAGTVAFNTSSDQRLKTNIVDAPSVLDKVLATQVRSYDWKEDNKHVEYGFIAQELYQHLPEVVGKGDDSEEITDPKGTWQLDYGRLTPMLVKAIQELSAQVTELKAEVALLKGV